MRQPEVVARSRGFGWGTAAKSNPHLGPVGKQLMLIPIA